MSRGNQEIAIVSGVTWFDDQFQPVNAHGACLIHEGGIFYLIGEYKTDDENTFNGFSCYSSTDLATWHFERMILPLQQDGLAGPNRIGERPKIMRSPTSGEYVLYWHADNLSYTDPAVGIATSDSLSEEFRVKGVLEHNGESLRRWDLGTFQDDDGFGYLLLHEGDIYRLTPDYLSVDRRVARELAPGGESPVLFKQDDYYYLLMSNKTMWESNENFYFTATSLAGPWTYRGVFAPPGSRTCNSQCTFVFHLPIDKGTTPIYMGDRWSFPRQASAATYVWQPLTARHGRLSIKHFHPSWSTSSADELLLDEHELDFRFESDTPGDSASTTFDGQQIAILGTATPAGAYAQIEILHRDVRVTSAFVSFYSPYPDTGYRYISPQLPHGRYTFRITTQPSGPECYDKRGTRYGSYGTEITVTGAISILR